MKSMFRSAAIGFALVLSAHAAHAQGLSFGLGGSAVVPTGDMSDGVSTGWGGMALVRVKPPVSPLGLQVDGFYNRFGYANDAEGHTRMLGATANAVFAFPGVSAARPYLIGGLGVYNSKASGFDESTTKFGANAGAGFDFGLGSAKLFAEARFHAIFKGLNDGLEEKTAYMIPITLGLRF
jgi:hypothetical protein